MDEIERRKTVALSAIRRAFDTEPDEFGVTLFVSHHLREIGASYWQKHLKADDPDPRHVLDMLVLQSHWGEEDEDGVDTFDFTLPGEITDYVISVHFDEAGNVDDISMES